MHVHFMPERVLDKVWSYFDAASEHYGVSWPIHYQLPEAERLAALRSFGPEPGAAGCVSRASNR